MIAIEDCMEHHTALSRGYVSRVTPQPFLSYKGRFGEGFTQRTPNLKSNNYCWITYYINKGDTK